MDANIVTTDCCVLEPKQQIWSIGSLNVQYHFIRPFVPHVSERVRVIESIPRGPAGGRHDVH